jgi:hypothetical protein
VKDDAAEDLEAFGVPAEMVNAVPVPAEDFDVWDDNVLALSLFMRLQTQWRIINGVFAGINYQSIQFLFDVYNVEDKATMMDDLQAMEFSALATLNKDRT